MDSVSPFVKGVEILPDGSVARTGTNYSGKFILVGRRKW
ncbi:hypothetical protein ABDI32_22790 [Bacillus wiedmannii]|nr:hypothetical protein [Bacillus wiedmannii]